MHFRYLYFYVSSIVAHFTQNSDSIGEFQFSGESVTCKTIICLLKVVHLRISVQLEFIQQWSHTGHIVIIQHS